MENLLDSIVLTQNAYNNYSKFAMEIAEVIRNEYPDISPHEIPDENARVLPNGDLEVYVYLKDKKISFVIGKDDWKYAPC